MVYGLKYRNLIVTELHPTILELAPSVSFVVYRRYRLFVEKDDVYQECIAWAMTRTEDIEEMLAVENLDERKHNEQKIAWRMRRVAERYARKEKANKSGYQTSDEVYYQSATLGQLLPFVIASIIDGTVLEQAQEMILDSQPKGTSSPSEGGGLLASLIDIKRAYLFLDAEDKDLLRYRHHESYTFKQMAALLECSVSTADRRCATALRRLQDNLGGVSPFK